MSPNALHLSYIWYCSDSERAKPKSASLQLKAKGNRFPRRNESESIGRLPAFAVDENVARLHVAVNHIPRVNEFRCVEELIHNVPLVNILQNGAALNDVVQIALHELERQINVHVIGRPTKDRSLFSLEASCDISIEK